MDSRQLPLASSSAATLVPHPFASSSTTLVPSSTDDVSAKEGLKRRKVSNASLGADYDDPDQSLELPTLPFADVCDASSSFKLDNVDRAFFPLRVVGNLAFRRPQNAAKMNEKGEELRFRCLKLQSTHADAISASALELLKANQVDLEEAAERLRIQREKAVESTVSWYDQQCIKYKAHKDEVVLYKETKAHHRQTKYVSEIAMRSKIDKAIGGKESFADGGKGKGRAWDDFNLSRMVPKPFRSTYPKS